MSLADVTSARSSPAPPCPECDATASVTSDLHKYQVACTCKPGSAQYACADEPGPPPPAKTDTPPALPPRPNTSTLAATNRRNNSAVGCAQDTSCRRRKYAWWCVGCGALAAALGGLLAAQHILVRAYTASPHHLETVPAAVPAAMLVLTGVCIMSLARRRNRYSYMIKVVGACCLMCALTCVLVTITTTVIHMNKLQTLKFCEYTKLTRTCTCFSMPPDAQHNNDDDGVRCVFEGVSECGVVHGALYWCLRGVFALSVTAVLVCIFSCMLAYQLLSHERKKMYWEQLELRCRSLYRPPSGQATPAGRTVQSNCSCCSQCHPSQPAWDISLQHRFWAPGRIGNLYSPNPGAGRKNSAWSWFPWPRSNSQNSRCRMNVPQSGDSAYGFCETDVPQQYDRPYPNYPPGQAYPAAQGSFQGQATFTPTQANYPPGQNYRLAQGNYPQGQNYPNYQEGFGESSGSFDAQTGVWGPPPPYSPQGRSGSRHHLHQDPATATLLHHHIDPLHTHGNMHTCSRNYTHMPENRPDMISADINRPDMTRADINRADMIRPDMTRADINRPDMIRADINRSDMTRADLNRSDMTRSEMNRSDMTRADLNKSDIIRGELNRSDMIRADLNRSDLVRADLNRSEIMRSTELLRTNDLNREMMRVNQDLIRGNPDMIRGNPDMIRVNDMGHIMQYPDEMQMDGRFNTLRGHLVPYRCQRIGMSASNLHRDCRMDDNVTIECLHQKSASKISDQSSDSCQKQGKENLGFQNDKHSPIRSSMQDCRGVNQNAESEVYFADVSSCCNVSVKAECCMNPTVSALVGTIENHPESTSESDTGSFTLTRSQRPQPQVGSKRRPKHTHKNDKHSYKVDKHAHKTLDKRHPNSSVRLTEHQIEQLNIRMNDPRMDRNEMRMSERNDSRDRLNDSRMINESRIERIDSRDRLNDSRSELDRMNDSRISERMNETRLSERMTERMSDRFERLNESRISERLNDSRLDRLNESRMDRMNDSRLSDRMNETRVSDRFNESRINRLNESDRSVDRTDESWHSDRLNETRMSVRLNETRMSNRMNETRMSDRMNETRMSDQNSSIRNDGSPKMRSHISPLRIPRMSPKTSKDSEIKPDFFVPPPPVISPLSPNTEESLLSDDDRPRDTVYSNDPESSKCLAPDSQYENKEKEILKANHHHCYSDTNTMDSGWQSGSEKQVTD